MGVHNNWPYIINLGNSIIGVAVLAMPFCFKQCGILLGMLVLLFCTWLTLSSCQMLMKAGIESRKRSYEFLAFHTHGATGKLVSEIGMIGMQLGTLIAQIVVIGDLGPAIISKVFGIENGSGLRTFLIMVLCLTVGLPLGLLKNLRTVSRASTVCISFYCIFVIYVIYMSLPNLWSGLWYPHVNFWRPQGLFQCLPILSFSFGCQTQLFLVYDALPDPSPKEMNGVISSAVNLCAVAYLLVGFFGYIAFYSLDIPGDVITIFPTTFVSDMMKLCFVFSIVITFPVIIFPCRASIYTLMFAKPRSKHNEEVIEVDGFIPENLFKLITILIVLGSMVTGILIPNVEFILGMNGAITGTLICYIFPALFFLQVRGSNSEGRKLAKTVLFLGITILIVSTYATLSSQEAHDPVVFQPNDGPKDLENPVDKLVVDNNINKEVLGDDDVKKKSQDSVQEEIRKEPPNPDPPADKVEKIEDNEKLDKKLDDKDLIKKEDILDSNVLKKSNLSEKVKESIVAHLKNADDSEKEAKQEEVEAKRDEVLAKLEEQQKEQAKILEEQREVLKELKIHHDRDVEKEENSLKEEKEEEEMKDLKKDVIDNGGLKLPPKTLDKENDVEEGFVKKKDIVPAPAAGINLPDENQKLAMNLQPPEKPIAIAKSHDLKLNLEPPHIKDSILSDSLVKKEKVLDHADNDKYNIGKAPVLQKQQLQQPLGKPDKYIVEKPVHVDKELLQQPIAKPDKYNVDKIDDAEKQQLQQPVKIADTDKLEKDKEEDFVVGAAVPRQKRDLLEGTATQSSLILNKPILRLDKVQESKSNISKKSEHGIVTEMLNKNIEMRRRLKNIEEEENNYNKTVK